MPKYFNELGNKVIVDKSNPDIRTDTFQTISVYPNGVGVNITGSAQQLRNIYSLVEISSGTQSAHVRAAHLQLTLSGNASATGTGGNEPRTFHVGLTHNSTGTAAQLSAYQSSVSIGGSGTAAGTVTLAEGSRARVGFNTGTVSGIVTEGRAFVAVQPSTVAAGLREITTMTMYYSESVNRSGITNPYAFYSVDGIHRFGGRVCGAKGADVASANDITLGYDGNLYYITGTTQVNTISATNWTAGSKITLIFESGITVAHQTAGTGAQFKLQDGLDLVTAAETLVEFIYDGTYWVQSSLIVTL